MCVCVCVRHRRPELLWKRGWPWPRIDRIWLMSWFCLIIFNIVIWFNVIYPYLSTISSLRWKNDVFFRTQFWAWLVGPVVPKCRRQFTKLRRPIRRTAQPDEEATNGHHSIMDNHGFSYPARECERGFGAEEMKLSNGSERGCAILSAWFHWSGRQSLPRWQQTWMLRQGSWSPCTRRCELRPAASLWQMPQQLQVFVMLKDNQEEEQWEENLGSWKKSGNASCYPNSQPSALPWNGWGTDAESVVSIKSY